MLFEVRIVFYNGKADDDADPDDHGAHCTIEEEKMMKMVIKR